MNEQPSAQMVGRQPDLTGNVSCIILFWNMFGFFFCLINIKNLEEKNGEEYFTLTWNWNSWTNLNKEAWQHFHSNRTKTQTVTWLDVMQTCFQSQSNESNLVNPQKVVPFREVGTHSSVPASRMWAFCIFLSFSVKWISWHIHRSSH